jgi:hypothetical protein
MDRRSAHEVVREKPRRRFLLQVPAVFHVGSLQGTVRGALVDLSLTGAFAIVYESLALHGPSPKDMAWVQLMCNDTWCQARGPIEQTVPMARALGVRVEFSGYDAAFSKTLHDWSRTAFSDPTRLARIRNVRITLR